MPTSQFQQCHNRWPIEYGTFLMDCECLKLDKDYSIFMLCNISLWGQESKTYFNDPFWILTAISTTSAAMYEKAYPSDYLIHMSLTRMMFRVSTSWKTRQWLKILFFAFNDVEMSKTLTIWTESLGKGHLGPWKY